jgi:hypothetical protein
VNVPVDITGVQDTLKAMRKFDKDLYQQMNKQIKAAMIPVRDKARGYAPPNSQMLSGWVKANTSTPAKYHKFFPKYDQNETQDGIVYRQGGNSKGYSSGQSFTRRWVVSHYVANMTAGGAIYETAGRRSGLGGRPTSHLVSSRHRFNKRVIVQSGTKQDNNSLNPNAGKQLMQPMGPLIGSKEAELFAGASTRNTGRLIYRAWAEDKGRASHAVNLAINTAVATFNATHTADRFTLVV